MQRGFELVSKKKNEAEGLLPLRATKTSAGYDFYTPMDLVIRPQEQVMIWTDIKAIMPEGEFLFLDVRSSMGVNNNLILANTIGVVDSDYYNNPKNEGNIGICLRNLKPSLAVDKYITIRDSFSMEHNIPVVKDLVAENTVVIPAGERVAQGIFIKYEEAENCNSDEERTGGIGSTSEQK